MPQEAAESNGSAYGIDLSVGNEGQGDGANFHLGVLTDYEGMNKTLTEEERVAFVQENLELSRALLSCYNPTDSGIGDGSLSFNSERFAHVIMRVGAVQVSVNAPRDGKSPTAESWARVLEQRIRSVMAGNVPTARNAP
ncbi:MULTISPECIES: hypothetical protein [unclassified Streptomyces]|nr:hypothetical protein [Streptomyces sp. sk2.1]TXS58135.1 hypothetical protein EAO76_43650 [Streptomyces sp. sk2.1]